MSVFAWVGMGIVVGLCLVVTYNRFIKLRNMVREGWIGIDVQLKRRAELISNLVAKLFAIVQAEFFAADAASERQVPKVDVGGAA